MNVHICLYLHNNIDVYEQIQKIKSVHISLSSSRCAGCQWARPVGHSDTEPNPLQNPIENVNQIAIRLGK